MPFPSFEDTLPTIAKPFPTLINFASAACRSVHALMFCIARDDVSSALIVLLPQSEGRERADSCHFERSSRQCVCKENVQETGVGWKNRARNMGSIPRAGSVSPSWAKMPLKMSCRCIRELSHGSTGWTGLLLQILPGDRTGPGPRVAIAGKACIPLPASGSTTATAKAFGRMGAFCAALPLEI